MHAFFGSVSEEVNSLFTSAESLRFVLSVSQSSTSMTFLPAMQNS